MMRSEPATLARSPSEIERLKRRLREFAHARSWERLHTAKNLTTAVSAEAGELAAILQWATADQDVGPLLDELEDEIADVLIYLVRLCDVLGVDPLNAAYRKIERNEQRFPARAPASSSVAHR
ncbi:MAG TPA: nucleotide pyrophosphohydrolase [Solirubrobacteraceae bacterium]|nr:nucleotide pyrophosphohydrolase [Solirubrobacteraceae bacterium]